MQIRFWIPFFIKFWTRALTHLRGFRPRFHSGPYFNNYIFHDIRDDINKFGSLNNPIMLCGDFNARTGNLVDFIPYLGEKHDTQNMNVHTQVNTQRRHPDHEINTHGQKLIEVCIENNLRIINGRCIGNSFGKCTFFTTKGGKSLIDYSIVSEFFFKNITCLRTKPMNYLSDHCLIITDISISEICEKEQLDLKYEWKNLPSIFLWNNTSPEAYKEALSSPQLKK